MTKQEMQKRIEELEKERFYLAMADRWTSNDYQLDNKLFKEITELKEKMLDK